jgi:hypothetical protein
MQGLTGRGAKTRPRAAAAASLLQADLAAAERRGAAAQRQLEELRAAAGAGQAGVSEALLPLLRSAGLAGPAEALRRECCRLAALAGQLQAVRAGAAVGAGLRCAAVRPSR